MRELLSAAADRAIRYLESLDGRSVAPSKRAVAALAQIDEPLPESPGDPRRPGPARRGRLAGDGGIAGRRYFGFVTGGSLPAAVRGELAGRRLGPERGLMAVMSPVAARSKRSRCGWVVEVLRPAGRLGRRASSPERRWPTSPALAAARHAVLAAAGWDVDAEGLFGAPPITVVVGEEVHVSFAEGARRCSGLGRERVVACPPTGRGGCGPRNFPRFPARPCLHPGRKREYRSFRPAPRDLPLAREQAGAWVHVDGAFGLWAAARPNRAHHMAGVERGRFLGHRRPQMAQRALRLRHGLRA